MDYKSAVRKSIEYIDKNIRDEIDINVLSAYAGYSHSQFHVIFSNVTGQTPAKYIRSRRLSLACWDLAFSRQGILDIAIRHQFSTQESFSRAFAKKYGITPGKFRSLQHIRKPKSINVKGVTECMNSDTSNKKVLEGVMRVGFFTGDDRCPESIPFPSCLASLMRYIGEDYPWLPIVEHNRNWRLNYANVHFLGASGMAFGLLWREGWHDDNVDHMFVADPREVIQRAFLAAGYSYEMVEKSGNIEDEELFREKIKNSLKNGAPVLAFGVIGPPECCLITGYDEDSDSVMGWNYFQDDPNFNGGVTFEPNGYFNKKDWFKDTWNLIIVGDKNTDFDTCLSNREMLSWGLRVMSIPQVYGRHSGFGAFDAWERHILDDTQFEGTAEDILVHRYIVHKCASYMLAECRYWGNHFLKHIASEEPLMEQELMEASAYFKAEHDLMWDIWSICGGDENPEGYMLFKSREIRRKTAEIIEKAKQLDYKAAALIKKAINR